MSKLEIHMQETARKTACGLPIGGDVVIARSLKVVTCKSCVEFSAQKKCRSCGETKGRLAFSKDARRAGGVMSACKECEKTRILRSLTKKKIKEHGVQYVEDQIARELEVVEIKKQVLVEYKRQTKEKNKGTT